MILLKESFIEFINNLKIDNEDEIKTSLDGIGKKIKSKIL